MATNPYCEKHEWPAGMGEPCPDCIALDSAHAETQYFQNQCTQLRAEKEQLLLQKSELSELISMKNLQIASMEAEMLGIRKKELETNRLLTLSQMQTEDFRQLLEASGINLCKCGGVLKRHRIILEGRTVKPGEDPAEVLARYMSDSEAWICQKCGQDNKTEKRKEGS